MAFLWKYPCGCIGVGTPPTPVVQEDGMLWHDVAIVKVCDPPRYCDDEGWLLPRQRVMESDGELPLALSKDAEREYFNFLVDLRMDADHWRSAKRLMKAVLEETS